MGFVVPFPLIFKHTLSEQPIVLQTLHFHRPFKKKFQPSGDAILSAKMGLTEANEVVKTGQFEKCPIILMSALSHLGSVKDSKQAM